MKAGLPFTALLMAFLASSRPVAAAPPGATAAAVTPPTAGSLEVRLRVPQAIALRIDPVEATVAQANPDAWLVARPAEGDGPVIQLSRRLLLHLEPGVAPQSVLQDRPVRVVRSLAERTWLLEASDAWVSVREALSLAAAPGVALCYPDMRRQQIAPADRYAPRPDDPFFSNAWHLENRDSLGRPNGADVNVRAAWPDAHGAGVTIAFADTGVDLGHPEFTARVDNGLHRLFDGSGSTNGLPVGAGGSDAHGTAVAGLAAAGSDNQAGAAGVAPAAQLASWKIFGLEGLLASTTEMAEMFQFRTDVVGIQNHSWGNSDSRQLPVTQVESDAISNAVTFGRGGRGVVMVRAAGNRRSSLSDANDDGYASSPLLIAVAAVQADGRVATNYSTPGACILVAAPGGGSDRILFTTDRRGTDGFNATPGSPWGLDYASDTSIKGTSFATPQVSGIVALLLETNPSLTVRDVQHLLLLSARHFDHTDPDLRTNGAGLAWSHNVGFGVPDAGHAVRLAKTWPTRPAVQSLTFSRTINQAIPDDGVRLRIRVPGLETTLTNIPATPGMGMQPDTPTPELPLVDLGYATSDILTNLTGKGALIQRGPNGTFADERNTFRRKIERAAQAGASFAVVYNNANGTERISMGDTDWAPIPAVFIDQNSGEALRDLAAQQPATVGRLLLDAVSCDFAVPDTLVCEHIGVRVRFSHGSRSQLRLTLRSPQGHYSILQRLNNDNTSGAFDWTYYSTQHFYESSAGTWTVAATDERTGTLGTLQGVDLILRGVPITDRDHDGLDDAWEQAQFGTLAYGAADDPDRDGYSNAQEQAMGSSPTAMNAPLRIDAVKAQTGLLRLSWPGQMGVTYQVLSSTNPTTPFLPLVQVPGRFPVTELFLPNPSSGDDYFRLRVEP